MCTAAFSVSKETSADITFGVMRIVAGHHANESASGGIFIMSTHISRGTRFFGLDPLEWLMLVAAILLVSIVALVF